MLEPHRKLADQPQSPPRPHSLLSLSHSARQVNSLPHPGPELQHTVHIARPSISLECVSVFVFGSVVRCGTLSLRLLRLRLQVLDTSTMCHGSSGEPLTPVREKITCPRPDTGYSSQYVGRQSRVGTRQRSRAQGQTQAQDKVG